MDKLRQKYLMQMLDNYCQPLKRRTMLFITVISLATIIQVFAISRLIELLLTDFQALATNWWLLGVVLLSFVVKAVTVYVRAQYTTRVAGEIKQRIRQEIIARSKDLGVRGLSNNTTSMSILYLEQVDLLNNYIARFYPQSIVSRIQPLLIVLAVFCFNWIAGLILALTSPLLPAFMILIGLKTSEMNAKQFKSLMYLGNQFHDKLTGIKTILAFSVEQIALGRLAQTSIDYTRTTLNLLKVAFLNSAVLEFLSSVCVALMAIYFGLSYIEQTTYGSYDGLGITLFAGYFCLTLAGEFFQPFKDLGTFYHDRSSALTAMDALERFINHVPSENLDYLDVGGMHVLEQGAEPNQNSAAHATQNLAKTTHNQEQLYSPTTAQTENAQTTQAQVTLDKETTSKKVDDLYDSSFETISITTNIAAPRQMTTKSSTTSKERKRDSSKHNHLLCAATAPTIPELKYPFKTPNSELLLDLRFNTPVVLSDVTIYTHSGKQLLSHVNMEFNLGQKIAIVGRSGAGKTTLLSLLMGIYPYTGSVTFSGVELTDIDSTQFFTYFSWLGQNPNLDQTTIAENLQYQGAVLWNQLDNLAQLNPRLTPEDPLWQFAQLVDHNPDLTRYSVQQVLEASHVQPILAGKGMNFVIAQHNLGLSGGQVQRIALARALAKPHLNLLIDEPTANLDAQLEAAIFENIQNHVSGVLMVTHRLDHAKYFERVYRLDEQGLKLVSQGETTCA